MSRLNPNRLVHIPEWGDFRIACIASAATPNFLNKSNKVLANSMDDIQIANNAQGILAQPNPEIQDSLEAENPVDDMLNEQTWPTEEELAEGEARQRLFSDTAMSGMAGFPNDVAGGKKKKKVPKGMSEYQAAWIPDDDDGGEQDDDILESTDDEIMSEDQESDNESVSKQTGDESEYGGDDAATSIMMGDNPDLDDAEEQRQYEEYKKSRLREEKDDAEFPDEVDTPLDIPARVRFQRYRGLESFRTSPWDPYENLPRDYARIFQFENFSRTAKRIQKEAMSEGVPVGSYVTLHLQDVPVIVFESHDLSSPWIATSLLRYEHQMSVAHFTANMETGGPEDPLPDPIRSKTSMVIQYGHRRYRVQPLFSEYTRGGGKGINNVHKFERYLRPGRTSMATVYVPISMSNVPALYYLENADGSLQLVATGSFVSVEPERILAKRIVLTGHPFKIHKRSAVVRYMFHNPEDIHWFKPVRVHTKYGRVGHIFESLGTHGYMKVRFDKQIKAQDTVCMNLYKRVFPKWTSEIWKPTAVKASTAKQEDEDVEM